MANPAVRFQNVGQSFRVIQERPDTLREAFVHFFRRKPRSTHHDFEALKHISFDVPHGTTLGIIGRNGSGKSTILKIIAGVYRPSSGSVEVNGSIAPLIELGAGFHHELTGRENILINGLLLGLSKREIQRLEPAIIEFAEIGDFIDAPVKQYSSGMYMRLAFSVATAVDPDILLVDEILSVGDAGFRVKCFERIGNFREQGKTIILVSHDAEQIRDFCDRALLIHNGELIADTSPEAALARYEEVIGHPQPRTVSALPGR
jgi:ABC-type polysaccharide/polyol phosphate transport system ATPase subunit